MRRFFYVTFFLSALFLTLFSCNGASNKADSQEEEIPMFVKADTNIVLGLVDEYMTHVKNKEYDAATDMLCHFGDTAITAISDEEKAKIITQHKFFPVINYSVSDIEFNNELDVTVTCQIEFFEKDPNDSIQNTIRFAFAPRRINADWLLSIKEY